MNHRRRPLGGIIHTYQKYDPARFPSPTKPPPDLISPAFEHMLAYGGMRELTEEELARAVRLDPSQIQGLGPSLEALMEMLRERKRKILATYETETVQEEAKKEFLSYKGKDIYSKIRHNLDFLYSREFISSTIKYYRTFKKIIKEENIKGVVLSSQNNIFEKCLMFFVRIFCPTDLAIPATIISSISIIKPFFVKSFCISAALRLLLKSKLSLLRDNKRAMTFFASFFLHDFNAP